METSVSRWSLSDVVAAQTRMQTVPARLERAMTAPQAARRHNNYKVQYQGQTFDSKHECEDFKAFELERAAGKLRAVVRQVSMPIAGSRRRIRIDFMLVENDGRIRWVDSKGYAEREWLLKRDIAQTSCGITIETC